MTNTYMLRSGELWFLEAVEILAAARQPDAWAKCQLTTDESATLREYLTRLERYERQSSNIQASQFDNYLAGLSLASLANPARPEHKPERTAQLIDFVARSTTRRNILNEVWVELRQALINGTIIGYCFLEVADNEKVPDEIWGKPYNANAHISGRVYLRKNPASSGLLGGRAFLCRQDLDNLISGNARRAEAGTAATAQNDTDPSPADNPDSARQGGYPSRATLSQTLKAAEKFMREMNYTPLTKTEAQIDILGKIFEGAPRDMIRTATKDIENSKKRPPAALVNRERELADCREAATMATKAKK